MHHVAPRPGLARVEQEAGDGFQLGQFRTRLGVGGRVAAPGGDQPRAGADKKGMVLRVQPDQAIEWPDGAHRLQKGVVVQRGQTGPVRRVPGRVAAAQEAFEGDGALMVQRGELSGVGAVEPRPQREIHARAGRGHVAFPAERFQRGRRRIAMRHLDHRGHAARRGAARAVPQLLRRAVVRAGEMGVGVHRARQDEQAARVDHLARLRHRGAGVQDGRDPAAANADIGADDRGFGHHLAATDQHIHHAVVLPWSVAVKGSSSASVGSTRSA